MSEMRVSGGAGGESGPRPTLIETTPLFAAIRAKEKAIEELRGEIEQLYARIADIEEGKHDDFQRAGASVSAAQPGTG